VITNTAVTTDELNAFLDRERIAVVHLSHYALMRPGVVFPADLLDAISNRDKWILSCCAIWPRHSMDLPGSIGILFRPTSVENVLGVAAGDAGTYIHPDGSHNSAVEVPSLASLEESVCVDLGRYNEWLLRGAQVAGIFVSDPGNLMAKKTCSQELHGESIEYVAPVTVSLEELRVTFPGLDIFTMASDGLVRI
jgi:hypothetical protein